MTLRKLVPIALLTAVALAAAARPVHSAPADTLGLPYVSDVHIEPAVPCPGQPVHLVVRGEFPNSCGRVLRTDPDSLTIFVRTAHPECGDCLAVPVPWSVDFDLGVMAAGHFAVRLTMVEIDSTCNLPPRVTEHEATIAFDVAPTCPQGDPMRYVDMVSITTGVTSGNPANDRICPGDSLLVQLGGRFPDDCHRLRRVELINTVIVGPTPGPPTVRLVFDNGCCLERLCLPGPVPWNAAVMLPPLPTGYYALNVEGFEVCCRDTVLAGDPYGTRAFPFRVTTPDSCGIAPPSCLMTMWDHSGRVGACDTALAPDGTAALTFMVRSSVALAALQGVVDVGGSPGVAPLHVTQVEPVGPAQGMHLVWQPTPTGASFVLFADSGAPIPPSDSLTDAVAVLRFTFAHTGSDSSADARWFVHAHDLLGADADGAGVPMCPYRTADRFAAELGIICAVSGQCDLNGDAHADVRDLVLMVHCLNHTAPCPANSETSLDCDGDHDFDLDDILCCATRVLSSPNCPGCWGDSARAEPAIGVQFGAPVRTDAGYDIPVRIDGADRIAAARLTFGMPDALAAGATITFASGGVTEWLKVEQGRPGERVVGLIDLTSPVILALRAPTLELTLHVPAPSGGSAGITLSGAEFSGRDGVRLVTDLGSPAVRIGAGVSLALGTAKPNPFGTLTEFRLSLDAAADVDLGVYDLAGRRVAQLHSGRLAIGVHRFSWDGRSDDGGRAGAGVYFVRASGAGASTVRKLILVKGQ